MLQTFFIEIQEEQHKGYHI